MVRALVSLLSFVVVLAFARPAQADWKKGDKVEVSWKGSWYKSTILDVKDAKFQIHYDGWGAEWDEWVTKDRIRAIAAAAPTTWKVGDKLDVLWKGTWYASTILEAKDGKFKIHYDGWGAEWDEWVGPDRMRARK